MPSQSSIRATSAAAADGMADRRLQTPVRDFMRPGVIAVSEDASLLQAERAMVRHGVHAILLLGRTDGRPIGWVTTRGVLRWLNDDLGLVPASKGVTESPTYIAPSAPAHEAVAALESTGAAHLLVARAPGETPQGVVADIDVITLCSGGRG
jgi:CBS domain-containing protein